MAAPPIRTEGKPLPGTILPASGRRQGSLAVSLVMLLAFALPDWAAEAGPAEDARPVAVPAEARPAPSQARPLAPRAGGGTSHWSRTGSLAHARYSGHSVLMPDGRVLLMDGGVAQIPVLDCERYDPQTGSWSGAGSAVNARSGYQATLLATGDVLVAGAGAGDAWSGAERYRAASGIWTLTAAPTWRIAQTLTLLDDGWVLMAGGLNRDGTYLDTAELYDPGEERWWPARSLARPRSEHTATRLASGRILVAGGYGRRTCEIYDPRLNAWTFTGSMVEQRWGHVAVALESGKVMAIGGGYWNVERCEIYDPATETWTPTGSLAIGRHGFTATALPQDRVLVVGGQTDYGIPLASSEIYDPVAGTWSPAGDMEAPRVSHTATLLPTGRVLVAGGLVDGRTATATCELYDPQFIAQAIVGFADFAPHRYGDGLISLAQVSGGASGRPVEFRSSDPAVAIITGNALTITGAGSAVITATQAGQGDYLAAPAVARTLRVDPAPLTVQADAGSRVYGTADTVFTGTLTGVLAGDDLTATFGSSAGPWTPVGTYGADAPEAIRPSLIDPGNRLRNYAVHAGNGVLSITPASQVISGFTTLRSHRYGEAPFRITGVVGGGSLNPVVFSSSDPAVAMISGATVTITGAGTTLITATQDADANHLAAAPVTQVLEVTPATLTITGPVITTAVGDPFPAFTAFYSGWVNGDGVASLATPAVLDTTANVASAPGSYPIRVSGASSPNYRIIVYDGVLTITAGPAQPAGGGKDCGLGGWAAVSLAALALWWLRQRT